MRSVLVGLTLLTCKALALSGVLSTLTGCGHCERDYIAALDRLNSTYSQRVAQFVCPYKGPKQRSDSPFVVGASPGTTATRALAHFLADHCAMSVNHWAEIIYPNSSSALRFEGVLLPLLRNMNETITGEDVDRLMEGDAFLRYVQEKRVVPGVGYPTSIGAVVDDPVDRFFYDFYKVFPNAYFILSDRDPTDWREKRTANHMQDPRLSMPILRAPQSWSLHSVSAEVAEGAYVALQELVKCLVPPERLLIINYFDEAENNTEKVEKAMADFLPKDACPGVKPPYVPTR